MCFDAEKGPVQKTAKWTWWTSALRLWHLLKNYFMIVYLVTLEYSLVCGNQANFQLLLQQYMCVYSRLRDSAGMMLLVNSELFRLFRSMHHLKIDIVNVWNSIKIDLNLRIYFVGKADPACALRCLLHIGSRNVQLAVVPRNYITEGIIVAIPYTLTRLLDMIHWESCWMIHCIPWHRYQTMQWGHDH